MATVLPSDLLELLNLVVDGQIKNYEINFEEVEFQGDNFLGEIMFVSLKNRNANKDFEVVVKKNIEAMTFFRNIYMVEISFYEDIWPVLNKFLEDSSIQFNKIPKYYVSDKTAGREKLVLENLKKDNFLIFDKTKPLEWQHVELVFKSYATFHATSYAFRELHPDEFTRLKNLTNKRGISLQDAPNELNTTQDGILDYVQKGFEYITKLYDEGHDQNIIKKFKKFTETSDATFFKSTKYTGDTPVLLHGDCWSNNMMFKYNENGDVIDLRFLDFQFATCGSPASDLSYFFYSGSPKDILDRLDELLHLYIKIFKETLEKLNCKPQKPYTFEKLKNEWKQYSTFGLGMAVMIWRTRYADKTKVYKVSEKQPEIPGLVAVAEEYEDKFNNQIKDLIKHFYENDLFEA